MNFNDHSELHGKHAFLSPSNHHWTNYTDQKLEARYFTMSSARRGTDLHALAHEAIRLGVKLSRSNKALCTYVNDAIGYRMACEQPLYFSENCFGHADTIAFRRNKLRIHDLKTGVSPSSPQQLKIYAALFCLEYSIDPHTIETELRIYQREDILVFDPHPDEILEIMDKIVDFDLQIQQLRAAEF